MMANKFHFRLEVVTHNGSISNGRGRSWAQAHSWYQKEMAKQIFPPKAVKVFLCVSGDEGELRTRDEVIVLGTE